MKKYIAKGMKITAEVSSSKSGLTIIFFTNKENKTVSRMFGSAVEARNTLMVLGFEEV